MSDDPSDDPRSAAIEQLEQFGLSTYAARTFVALKSLGTGTAKDVSGVSDVPRTRVYDATDELHEQGLVDVQQSSPKQFWAISSETARGMFEQEMDYRLSVLSRALEELEPASRSEEQQGVWTVNGQPAVTDRVMEFVQGADDEIVYMTVEDLLTDDVIDALGTAAERGVTISLGGVSSDVQDRIEEDIPGAELFDSLWVWSDTPAGRLMMVDGTQTLVSVLVNGEDSTPTDPRSETAIWGSGETNSLVVVLRAIFTWKLEDAEPPA
ncbi:TrmB family transcriptional regulator [Halobacteriales archaeon QS_8_69_26]|nr:MAG: TrmB family transcriptional regulator [Halobacteriales archaeon QS_8_69_26]